MRQTILLAIAFMVFASIGFAASTFCITLSTGNVCFNNTLTTGTKLNWSDILNAPAFGSGTVTSVTRGSGFNLSGTSITVTGTLDINNSRIQNRVTGTCSPQAVESINLDGTVNCISVGGAASVPTSYPAANISSGTFGANASFGNYIFRNNLSVGNLTVNDNLSLQAVGNCPFNSFLDQVGGIVICQAYLNTSLANLDARQRNDNTTLGNRNINTNFPLGGGGNLQADRTLTFDNTSYANLDARQRADNASIARLNIENVFTANMNYFNNLNLSGYINASTFIGNLSNATFPISNLSCAAGAFVQNLTMLKSGLLQIQCSSAAGGGTVTSVGGTFPITGLITSSGNLSLDNTSYANLDTRERINNNSQTDALNNLSFNVSALNVSTNNLDAREKANNATQDLQLQHRTFYITMGMSSLGFNPAASTQYILSWYNQNPTTSSNIYNFTFKENVTLTNLEFDPIVVTNLGGCANNVNCTFNMSFGYSNDGSALITNTTVIYNINFSVPSRNYYNDSLNMQFNDSQIMYMYWTTPAWTRLPTAVVLGIKLKGIVRDSQ